MSEGLKIALVVAFGLIAATALYLYFSPYQSCVRAYGGGDGAKMICARK